MKTIFKSETTKQGVIAGGVVGLISTFDYLKTEIITPENIELLKSVDWKIAAIIGGFMWLGKIMPDEKKESLEKYLTEDLDKFLQGDENNE
jgi:hypothetical protein